MCEWIAIVWCFRWKDERIDMEQQCYSSSMHTSWIVITNCLQRETTFEKFTFYMPNRHRFNHCRFQTTSLQMHSTTKLILFFFDAAKNLFNLFTLHSTVANAESIFTCATCVKLSVFVNIQSHNERKKNNREIFAYENVSRITCWACKISFSTFRTQKMHGFVVWLL